MPLAPRPGRRNRLNPSLQTSDPTPCQARSDDFSRSLYTPAIHSPTTRLRPSSFGGQASTLFPLPPSPFVSLSLRGGSILGPHGATTHTQWRPSKAPCANPNPATSTPTRSSFVPFVLFVVRNSSRREPRPTTAQQPDFAQMASAGKPQPSSPFVPSVFFVVESPPFIPCAFSG